MSWSDVGEVIKAVAPIFTAGAACSGALIAYKGLERWKRETVGRRRIELAEEVLADFYQARDIVQGARFPHQFSSDEGKTRQQASWEAEDDARTLNSYFRPIERLHKKIEFFSQLHARKYRVLALFGQEAVKPYDELFRIREEIVLAVEMLITTHGFPQLGSHLEDRKSWETTIGRRQPGTPDPIDPKLTSVIEAIERVCQPIIQAVV